jgi:hypothetical protein
MNRRAQAVVMVLFGVTILQASLTDEYLRYVKPGMRPFLIGAGLMLAVTGVMTLWYQRRRDPSDVDASTPRAARHRRQDTHAHSHEPRLAWLLLGRPSLPAQFADFSRFTSRAVDRPAGRAIALYEYGSSELFVSWQTLVVGADQDTYRRLDMETDPAPPVKLSPDGRFVMYFHASRGTDEFTLLDLTTGQTSIRHSVEWVSNVGASIDMLAWSPDGRYLAYAVPAPPPARHRGQLVPERCPDPEPGHPRRRPGHRRPVPDEQPDLRRRVRPGQSAVGPPDRPGVADRLGSGRADRHLVGPAEHQ